MLFVDVAIASPVRKLFTYSVPKNLEAKIGVGIRVYIDFNHRNSIGFITHIHDRKPTAFKVKPILEVLDKQPLLSKNLILLADWIHKYWYCSLGEVYQAMLPAGLNYQSEKWVLKGANAVIPIGLEKYVDVFKTSDKITFREYQSQFQELSSKELNQLQSQNLILIKEIPYLREQAKEFGIDWFDSTRMDAAISYLNQKNKLSFKWEVALKTISTLQLPITTSELEQFGIKSNQVQLLKSKGYIKTISIDKNYQLIDSSYRYDPHAIRTLNKEQSIAYLTISNAFKNNEVTNFLLRGVTGSGKTEVYIHVIKDVLDKGKSTIILVPEIALTPQTVRRFYEIFGDEVSVLHSRLTESERLFTWKQIKNGEKKIVIGPRSAVFAPVKDLGLIILDEEHDASFKQEQPSPRYHARQVAEVRGFIEKANVILGSATPSIVTWNRTKKGELPLLELKNRHAQAELPQVNIIDLKQYKSAMKGPFSIPLFQAIDRAILNKEQVILLLNRRGYSPLLNCTTCGKVQECKYCSVTLTYHKSTQSYRCHYCGYSKKEHSNCNYCNAKDVVQLGSGTQRIEEDIASHFPDAKVMRMDQDTTSGKHAHKKLTESFLAGQADILIGTQLVSKGLDFPNVTVVGVLNSDTELAFASYKAQERMFQLLSQVSGRAGRAEKKGYVFLQTWNPDLISVQTAQSHNYKQFAEAELHHREEAVYPPFCKLIEFTLVSRYDNVAEKAAEHLKQSVTTIVDWPILGPTPATIHKRENKYYWTTTLKIPTDFRSKQIEQLLDKITTTFEEYLSSQKAKSTLYIHVDV